jgi:antitoxin component YwqK of YwqJK toxin-antitoxin module
LTFAHSFWHPNGKLKEKGSYKNDKKHGSVIQYNNEGKKTKVSLYYHGDVVQAE